MFECGVSVVKVIIVKVTAIKMPIIKGMLLCLKLKVALC